MGGFTFTIIIFLLFVLLMSFVISNVKGEKFVYLFAITVTLSAWFIGLILDANINFSETEGFLAFRILLPILAMGICILKEIQK